MYLEDRYLLECDMSVFFQVDQEVFKKLSMKEFKHLLSLNYSECKKILDTLQGVKDQLKYEKIGINYSTIRFNRRKREETARRRKEAELEKVQD
ncbi:MAG: hypothetical protein ACRC6B_12610 [Fusobacteriaceae bacterium]